MTLRLESLQAVHECALHSSAPLDWLGHHNLPASGITVYTYWSIHKVHALYSYACMPCIYVASTAWNVNMIPLGELRECRLGVGDNRNRIVMYILSVQFQTSCTVTPHEINTRTPSGNIIMFRFISDDLLVHQHQGIQYETCSPFRLKSQLCTACALAWSVYPPLTLPLPCNRQHATPCSLLSVLIVD